MPPADVIWVLDSPSVLRPWVDARTAEIAGWIATTGAVHGLAITGHDGPVELRTCERPDVVAAFGLPAVGFEGQVPVRDPASAALAVEFDVDGRHHSIAVPPDRWCEEGERRARKLARLRPHLRCVCCRGELRDLRRGLRCTSCGARYPAAGGHFDLLPEWLRTEFAIVDTDNVSSNAYDGTMMDIVHRHLDGLVLDCGAGNQRSYYPNVVNLEVVAYPSTDVLAVGESLPFADGTFDAVASLAVLEHVKDPFRCAQEIVRVLKPGGTLYCQVPFLQPLHAYPNHFYNMSQQGLNNLFEPLEVIADGVIPFGQPIFALSWMLASYAAGLPEGRRAEFESMTVAELMAPPSTRLGAPFVVELSREARAELSCANHLLARRPAVAVAPAPGSARRPADAMAPATRASPLRRGRRAPASRG